jgi:hypothetical protein
VKPIPEPVHADVAGPRHYGKIAKKEQQNLDKLDRFG